MWMDDRDRSRTIARAWFLRESTETGDILTNEWPDDFRKVEIVTLTLPSRVSAG